jgi:hypothetical protein
MDRVPMNQVTDTPQSKSLLVLVSYSLIVHYFACLRTHCSHMQVYVQVIVWVTLTLKEKGHQ